MLEHEVVFFVGVLVPVGGGVGRFGLGCGFGFDGVVFWFNHVVLGLELLPGEDGSEADDNAKDQYSDHDERLFGLG